MNNEEYFEYLLSTQKLTDNQVENLQNLRDTVETRIKQNLGGSPRVVYGGSYKKGTMIREAYDLDLVFYWSAQFNTLEALYDSVGSCLQSYWGNTRSKRLGWQIPFAGEFHIDVIPGLESSQNDRLAYLYNRETRNRFQSSVDIQIEHIKSADRAPTIKLMKLWKVRKNVPITSFILENMVIDSCNNISRSTLAPQFDAAFRYLADNITTIRVKDPANSSNIISDHITMEEKYRVQRLAQQAVDSNSWGNVFQ